MKKQLSSFIIYLFLSCLCFNSLSSLSLNSNQDYQLGSLSDINMLDTPEGGLLVDINPDNMYFDRINLQIKKATKVSFDNIISDFTYTLVLNEELARLKITLNIPGMLLYTPGSGSYYCYLELLFGNQRKVIGYDIQTLNLAGTYFTHFNAIELSGVVYNVIPGFYDISVRYTNNENTKTAFYASNFALAYPYYVLEGELKTNFGSDNFIVSGKRENNDRLENTKLTNLLASVDDYFISVLVNNAEISPNIYNPSNLINDWRYAKSVPVKITSGDEVKVFGRNAYGNMGIIATIPYFDNFGVLRFINSVNGDDFKINNSKSKLELPLSSNASRFTRPIDNDAQFLFPGYTSDWAYNTLSIKLPVRKTFKSILYITPISQLLLVKIGDTSIDYEGEGPENIVKISKKLLGRELQSGDKIEITLFDPKNYSAGAMAVAFYQDKNGKLMEATSDNLLICGKNSSKQLKPQNPRSDWSLGAGYPNVHYYVYGKGKDVICTMTLP